MSLIHLRKGAFVQSNIRRRAFLTTLAMLGVPLFAIARDGNADTQKDKDREKEKEKNKEEKEEKKDEAKDKAKDAAEDHDKVVDGPGTDQQPGPASGSTPRPGQEEAVGSLKSSRLMRHAIVVRRSVQAETVTPSTDILIGDTDRTVRAHSAVVPEASRACSTTGTGTGSSANSRSRPVHFAAGSGRDLRSEEFHAFLEDTEGLSRALEGVASFNTVEGCIAFALTGDGNGDVRVSGEAVDTTDAGNRLLFDFGIDQTCLRDICQSLEYLLAAFPVTGTPDA